MIVHSVARMRWHSGNLNASELLENTFRQLEEVWRDKTQPEAIRYFARKYMLQLRPISGAGTSTATADDLLKLILNATPIANLADNAASSPITTIAFALYTADPGAGGNMSTNEVTYTSYARVNVNRSSGSLTVTGNVMSPAANIVFPTGTGGSGIATFAAAGYPGGGAAKILFSGPIGPQVTLGNSVTPTLTTATTITLV